MKVNRKWSALACAVILLTCSGCGKRASMDGAQEKIPPATFIPVQEFLGAGIYNEDVLRQLNHDIMIGDKKFTLPCSLAALGEEFSFYKNPATKETYVFEQEANGLAELELCYRGERVATVYYVLLNEEGHDYTNDLICKINISSEKSPFSIGGIRSGAADRDELVEKLGEPTTEYDLNNGGKVMEYGDNRVTFRLDGAGMVSGAWMWVNTDPVSDKTADNEEFTYSGVYDAEVFASLNRDILISGRSFCLPFSLEDLGAGFTFQKDQNTDKIFTDTSSDGKSVFLRLCFYGEKIAYVKLPVGEPGHDYSGDPIEGIRFGGDNCQCSVGGIEIQKSTKQDVLDKLGSPDRLVNFVTRKQEMIYGQKNFIAELDMNGVVTGIQIQLNGSTAEDQSGAAAMPGYAPFAPEGSFGRDSLDRLARDFVLAGKRTALPCALRDFGEEFYLLEDQETGKSVFYTDAEAGTVMAFLCYRGETIALLEYPASEEENHDYAKDAICGIRLDENYFLGNADIQLSAAGLTVSETTRAEVIAALGQPAKQENLDNGTEHLTYDGEHFYVTINRDGFLESICFSNQALVTAEE